MVQEGQYAIVQPVGDRAFAGRVERITLAEIVLADPVKIHDTGSEQDFDAGVWEIGDRGGQRATVSALTGPMSFPRALCMHRPLTKWTAKTLESCRAWDRERE